MTSIDTNIIFQAFSADSSGHDAALNFIASLSNRADVVISEFMLTELYRLVRNPAVMRRPLNEGEAVELIQHYRSHPHWRVVGFPETGSEKFHTQLWRIAAQ